MSDVHFSLNHNDTADLIAAVGHTNTILVRGDMGQGKSSLLKTLACRLPEHIPVYFDGTTKDVGDMFIPNIVSVGDDSQFVRFVPNEELGFHHKKPVILMLDELGKMTPGCKNAAMRIMLERTSGCGALPEGSIVFATTNLGTEGVGDVLLPHHRNRITVVRLRKPSGEEWLDWAYNAGINPVIVAWVKEVGDALFESFENVQHPDDNPYIFHPKASGRDAFVTGRSLEKASNILWHRGSMSAAAVKAALMGTVGLRAGADLDAFIQLADTLPKQSDIMNNPESTPIPTSASVRVMVVDRALATMRQEMLDSWMTYLARLDLEAQSLFFMQARKQTYNRRDMVLTHAGFRDYAIKNNFMFN